MEVNRRVVVGRAWVVGDNVDTDVIIPARYLTTQDPEELARHVLEDLDPTVAGQVQPGDVLVAGTNFGCGSSREHAPIALKAAGFGCVVARSFARIFYRNAVNIGLPVLECPDGLPVRPGERVEVRVDEGRIVLPESGREVPVRPMPPVMREILEAGGLVPYVRRRLQADSAASGAQGT